MLILSVSEEDRDYLFEADAVGVSSAEEYIHGRCGFL